TMQFYTNTEICSSQQSTISFDKAQNKIIFSKDNDKYATNAVLLVCEKNQKFIWLWSAPMFETETYLTLKKKLSQYPELDKVGFHATGINFENENKTEID